MRALIAIALALGLCGSSTARAEPKCEPLPVGQWHLDSLLVVHEATTCRYRVTWTGWSPPRSYDYVPDAQGWVSDYFISGSHARVFWNLRTSAVVVRPISQDRPIDESEARAVAQWALATNFPGLDLAKFSFNPSPCPPNACAPQ